MPARVEGVAPHGGQRFSLPSLAVEGTRALLLRQGEWVQVLLMPRMPRPCKTSCFMSGLILLDSKAVQKCPGGRKTQSHFSA